MPVALEDGVDGDQHAHRSAADQDVGARGHLGPELAVAGSSSTIRSKRLSSKRPVDRRAGQRADTRHLAGQPQVGKGFDANHRPLPGLDAVNFGLADRGFRPACGSTSGIVTRPWLRVTRSPTRILRRGLAARNSS